MATQEEIKVGSIVENSDRHNRACTNGIVVSAVYAHPATYAYVPGVDVYWFNWKQTWVERINNLKVLVK